MTTMRSLLSVPRALRLSTLLLLPACGGGGPVDFGEGGGGEGGGTSTSDGGAGGGGTGPNVEIRMRSSTAPFPHTDELSGQTPTAHSSGLRSLTLFRSKSDPSPFVVFDLGENPVEVDYADGADTLAYTARASDLPEATFTVARVVHTHVRYRVAATMHAMGLVVPGFFDNVQVMSDGTLLDGQLRDAGYFEYTFEGGGQSFPASGDDAPVPEYTSSGGFEVVRENGEWAYYFPVSLVVTPNITEDVQVVLSVNMHESYRWQDQTSPGYMSGVFDVTPTSFEPVLQFGANSFALTIE
jgi:hypothetical protein